MESVPQAESTAAVLKRSSDTDTKEEPTVIQLTSSVTIAAGTALYVICNLPIEIESRDIHRFTISAASPTLITAPAAMAFTLLPSGCLGPDFARGWQKLSDELKVNILRFNLIIDSYVEYGDTATFTEAHCLLYKHLAMGPEIASLSREIFYKENIFRLTSEIDFEDEESAFLPPLELRPLIRNIELYLCVQCHDWCFMQSVLEGCRGFDNLQSLHIRFWWDARALEPFLYFFRSEQGFTMEAHSNLSCKLQLTFEESHNGHKDIEDVANMYGCTISELQKDIGEKLLFNDNTDSEDDTDCENTGSEENVNPDKESSSDNDTE
jgi:hypothetical protein